MLKMKITSSINSEKVIDKFEAAGPPKPDISILSDEFMPEVKGMKHNNLALELLKKILNDKIKARGKSSLVCGRKLIEMLEVR